MSNCKYDSQDEDYDVDDGVEDPEGSFAGVDVIYVGVVCLWHY